MASNPTAYYADPMIVMDPRNLGAMQPNRLSASRSFIAKMTRENWRIERELLELDDRGNGRARYAISTPEGSITFLAYLSEPSGKNRTGRIIGTSWDMIGALIDGVATSEQVRETEEELPRLYEGRATPNTLVWFRSNQSLRIFRAVRQSLARGQQPDAKELSRVGYVMRNTGLDGNGTFGTTPFAGIGPDHPLRTSYHAQMLSAYLMREMSADLVEELAFKDSPATAVRLDPAVRRLIGVGNGSALGLAMLVYNRPVLVNAYISAFLDVLDHVLTTGSLCTGDTFDELERLLSRTIRYRSFLTTSYRFFTSNMEIVGDLRRIRAMVRAGRRGEIHTEMGETALGAIHREATGRVSKEALHSFNTLLLELVPEYCDEVGGKYLDFTEELDLDPRTTLAETRETIDTHYSWATRMPLNDEYFRDRVWYQSRAAEEPRSGPREEVPEAHELIQSYPVQIRRLLEAMEGKDANSTLGELLFANPELEYISRLILGLRDKPYAVPHADPHDTDFIPVWIIRFVNSFIHGLDRTEDHMGRDVRGIIFENAPYRDAIGIDGDSEWWWSYDALPSRTTPLDVELPAPIKPEAGREVVGTSLLTPIQTPITPPSEHATDVIEMKFRELRLMAGRAYQALNVPEGSWTGAREFLIRAVAADTDAADAFGRLLTEAIDPGTAQSAPWTAPTAHRDEQGLVIDNHGQSLLATGHAIVNLLGALAGASIQAFRIDNVEADHAIAGIELDLARYGIELSIEREAPAISGRIRVGDNHGALVGRYRERIHDFLLNGRTISSTAFWNIYYRANAGLDVDTPISRQHTGGTVLDVIKPGEKITKQFSSEELHLLTDPDELDNRNFPEFIDTH